jgi:hypothetical protein
VIAKAFAFDFFGMRMSSSPLKKKKKKKMLLFIGELK